MEAFVVLFFTFVCQHIQSLQKSAASAFTWLQSDSNLEQVREYFPPHIIQGIQPNTKNPVQLRLSVLLNAFQEFVTKFEALICENKSLESRAKLLHDLVERSTKLEDEIQEYRRRDSQMVKNTIELASTTSNGILAPHWLLSTEWSPLKRALTHFNTLQKPVKIKASASLIIHIWSNQWYTMCHSPSTLPSPPPLKAERGFWWVTFLVTWVGASCIRNVCFTSGTWAFWRLCLL